MATAKRRCFSFLFLLGILVGTTAWAEPIGIATIEDLQKIGNAPAYPLDGHYVLTQNIDASNTRNWNEGTGFSPIGFYSLYSAEEPTEFSGVLDGQGYYIDHLYIGKLYLEASGLFACIGESAEVKNLGLRKNGVWSYMEGLLGGIAACNKGTITACYTTGSIVGIGGAHTGGNLVGRNEGTISQCCSLGGTGGEGGAVGGLVGTNIGLIKQCYAIGHVCEESSVGGLVGYNRENGTIEECYAVGGAFGEGVGSYDPLACNNGVLTACFHHEEETDPYYYPSGISIAEKASSKPDKAGTALTGAEMMQKSTFTAAGWDFDTLWNIQEGSTYPYLQTLPKHLIRGEIVTDTWIAPSTNSADQNANFEISVSELLRTIQLFNSDGYQCGASIYREDGFALGMGETDCLPHSADYNTQDWKISLSELLRVIQLFNCGNFYYCGTTEDGFCIDNS